MMLEGAFARLPEASVLRLSEPLPEAELLALPDVVVSGASAMNLEVLSYAGTAAAAGQMPLSVYLTDPGQALFPGYWGPGLPSTHRPDGGSILVQAGGLVSGLIAVLEDQPAHEAMARAALKYAPGGDAARAAIRTAVLAWLNRPTPTPGCLASLDVRQIGSA